MRADMTMHRKIVMLMNPNEAPGEAIQDATNDWERDSEGQLGLDRERFDFCW